MAAGSDPADSLVVVVSASASGPPVVEAASGSSEQAAAPRRAASTNTHRSRRRTTTMVRSTIGDDGFMADLIFGAFVPQGWKMELAGIADPAAKWARAVDIARQAERLGYDSIWVYDHFHNIPRPAHEAVFECWTVLAAMSQVTERVRLGQMVTCAAYRNPAYLAKVASTVDVISGGRVDFGIGAGWYEHEFEAYGYGFPPAKERIRAMRETVEIVRSMWTEPETTYDGPGVPGGRRPV